MHDPFDIGIVFDNSFHQVPRTLFVNRKEIRFMGGFGDPGVVHDVIHRFDHLRESLRFVYITKPIVQLQVAQQGPVGPFAYPGNYMVANVL